MLKNILLLSVAILFLGCGSSVKATGDASEDPGSDGSGDTAGEVPTDAPVPDGEDDPVEDPATEVPGTCGDGNPDTGEECDDGNDVDGDGCDNDCTYSCHDGEDCADGDMCTDDVCTEHHTCANPASDCSDDDPCTVDSCDSGEGCINAPLPDWYRDFDGDDYGDPHDHRCQESRPEGYVDNDDDCCDTIEGVNPDHTDFERESYDCGGLSRSFDFNCDGTEEQRWTALGSCTRATDGTCVGSPGWRGSSPPACGASGEWMGTCMSGSTGGGCMSAGTTRVQECR